MNINEAPETIPGERGLPSVNRFRSIRSRIGTWSIGALFTCMAVIFLYFYYTTILAKNPEKDAPAQKKPVGSAAIPPFMKPLPAPTPVAYTAPPAAEQLPAPPLTPTNNFYRTVGPPGAPPEAPKSKTASQLDLERRLGGSAVYRGRGQAPVSAPVIQPQRDMVAAVGDSSVLQAGGGSDLAGLLRPTVTAITRSMQLPALDWLLPKGEFLDCALITAIDSTLPGMTACILSTDAWSADGSRKLMIKGTKLVGETRGEIRQGQKRVFILWSEARTPDGQLITLASPGTDALGRSGVEGEIDRHWGERFGAALMLSIIDGAITAAASSRGNGNVNVGIGGSSGVKDVMTEVLKSTINIPPTIMINQGERVQIFVARDIYFGGIDAASSQH